MLPLDQLCLSPHCGFSSAEEGNTPGEEAPWAKIRLVVETAKRVWHETPARGRRPRNCG